MDRYRNITIDCMKGLAIVLMVIGHIHLSSRVDKYIYIASICLCFLLFQGIYINIE